MEKLIKRLLIFFIGLPLLLALVHFDTLNHILLHAAIIIVVFIAANEIYGLNTAGSKQPKKFVILLTVLISVIAALCCIFDLAKELITFGLIFAVILSMLYEVFFPCKADAEIFSESNQRISAAVFDFVYSGYLITFLSRMTTWENSKECLYIFFLMVYGCDSLAWFFGMLFGKNNRGYIAASPNKSIIGFIGGTAGSICAGIAAHYVFPDIFYGSPVKVILLGLLTALAAILGDLAESVFKRSAKQKDSGNVIPGRGGILDSIDSVLIAAPVYYIATTILFGM
ncbi:MAG: phosphatidate cytidylyltransferase [Bacteroides sp.]|nr:phosphatidate cytidylyltransferase [Prevotella sp.]MCM1408222.1 phosphatidate cytidylyltransferase [Treponema brennaborense]MCM1469546.1 phosphatidate cytidylyltransferase [Bacteroides sp.]